MATGLWLDEIGTRDLVIPATTYYTASTGTINTGDDLFTSDSTSASSAHIGKHPLLTATAFTILYLCDGISVNSTTTIFGIRDRTAPTTWALRLFSNGTTGYRLFVYTTGGGEYTSSLTSQSHISAGLYVWSWSDTTTDETLKVYVSGVDQGMTTSTPTGTRQTFSSKADGDVETIVFATSVDWQGSQASSYLSNLVILDRALSSVEVADLQFSYDYATP